MRKIYKKIYLGLYSTKGVTAVETALIAAAIILVILAGIKLIGSNSNGVLFTISSAV